MRRMNQPAPPDLIQAIDVALQYMIVDKDSLEIRPLGEDLIAFKQSNHRTDPHHGLIRWDKELVSHLITLSNTKSVANFNSLDNAFADHVKLINTHLSASHAMLLPTAAHPLMHPDKHANAWAHSDEPKYQLYHRIFNCEGHGWNNVQHTRLRLPFKSDDAFGRLHAAVRVLLPLIPAISASSPIVEGRASGSLDTRLQFYKTKQSKLPIVTGRIIPEPHFSPRAYREEIYEKIDEALAPYDKDHILTPEEVNARGAVPYFDQGYLEIRILDTQECPTADMAIIALITETLEALMNEKFAPLADQREILTEVLGGILDETVQHGRHVDIYSNEYASLFGINSFTHPQQLWQHILTTLIKQGSEALKRWEPELEVILQDGPLAERILKAVGPGMKAGDVIRVYRQVAECLAQNRMFIP